MNKREHRTDETVMVVEPFSPKNLAIANSGAAARERAVAGIRVGAPAYIAISTGPYPNWIESANLEQVYPVLSVYAKGVEVYARVGQPLPITQAFAI